MSVVLLSISKAVGSALVAAIMALITGKTLKTLVYRILHALSGKTSTKEDDAVVEAVRKDWELESDSKNEKEEKE